MRIDWAPLDVPWERRLQTLAASAWIALIMVGEIACITLFVKLLYSDYYLLGLVYLWWMLLDIDKCNQGGRRSQWACNWSWWHCLKDYFPVKLIKTADLDPNENYLLACFPHGIVCIGAFTSFATNALEFGKVFPGMTSHLVTLRGHFAVPFFRDLALSLGGISALLESMLYALNPKNGTGKCVALMVGGAAESLNAQPGEYRIILKKRKGFIKVALKSGASLVPVFTFNETSAFRPLRNPSDSKLRKFQEWVRKTTGIAPMLPIGRGIFQYNFGVLPLRQPLYTVVGAPIKVEKISDPTDEQVDQLHQVFTDKLMELFEKEKHKYLKDPKSRKLIIE